MGGDDGICKTADRRWWKEAVVYQVYPASFLDTNADGLGDINGITAKLDYLKDLGVDILWCSPIYESPQEDMGYDISNYRDIHPPYGTMKDVDRLIQELKLRNMKLIMDLVVNHTSSQHPWFLESLSSKTSKRRDWYIWRKPKYSAQGTRQPPSNWASLLDDMASAWTYDPGTDEYYLSLFSPHQPDLNWDNPEVREEVNDILRFWLDRGVSGFRMDVVNLISKDQRFPDADVVHGDRLYQPADKYFANGARLLEYLQGMKAAVLSKYDTLTVGEMPFLDDDKEQLEIIKAEEGVLNMIFTFEMMGLDILPEVGRFSFKKWCVDDLRKVVDKAHRMITNEGWHALFCENHDQPRSVTRFCDDSDEHRSAGAKLLSIMQTTLPGTLYVYQGEELGMRNIPTSWGPEEYKDIESVNYWKRVCEKFPEGSDGRKDAKHLLQLKARDNARTPMQWNSTSHGGFCPLEIQPWMRVNDDYAAVNADIQMTSPRATEKSMFVSPYRFWQRSLDIRKRHVNLLVYGDFEIVGGCHPTVLAFRRWCDEAQEESITILNFSGDEADFELPAGREVGLWAMGSYDVMSTEKPKTGHIRLMPWEGMLGFYKLNRAFLRKD